MPCRSDYDGYSDSRELDKATRVACELARVLRQMKPTTWKNTVSTTAQIWIERHDEADRKRLEQEAAEAERKRLAKQARSKLTPAEREALGIR